ncbi:ras association domain-containing protein 10 [Dunckerocampus dactyliophorus]|uniref:ras association domain-containing protein 10 n=1 Tax=Dunckerocampus dactyliophorus TaxID=161453 RepID=UPI00240706EC|nr:ras association domain-containing protein 10 [Dunckerocampus dactyliophorus]
MDLEEGRISVWVCREEKIVLGLSKRTTCSDVVKVLLEDPNSRKHLQAASAHHCYCIVEKWRSFQRILPNKTRIWRLWVAWGEERDQVKFMLVDNEVFVDKRAARSAEARVVVLSKPNPFVSKWSARGPLVVEVPPDKQRRIVRKAFRKLEKMQQKKHRASSSSSSAEKMQSLAQLVVSQDNTIRLQALRIQELDAEIEMHEAKVHMDRTRSHGINYVQDTYLLVEDDAAAASSQQVCSSEVFFHLCDDLMRLQEKLWEQEALVDMLTMQMEEELNHHWMQRRLQEMHRRTHDEGQEDAVLFLEEERLRSQLDVSLYIGLRLRSDLEAIRGDLELSRQICSTREEEMRDLLEKMNSLGLEDRANTEGETDETGGMRMVMSILERKSEWVEQARGLSKCHRGNDDDSDTGLSSLHSQESDSMTVCESLV